MVDRAHNIVLDWLASAGALGLVAGVLLFRACFRTGARGLARQADRTRRTLLAGCLGAVAGALGGNLLDFDVTATATATWLLLALLPALVDERPLAQSRSPGAATERRWWAAALFLPALAFVVVLNARPVLADIAARTANRRAAAGDVGGAVAHWERAIELWPAEPAYRMSLAWLWLQSAQHTEGSAVLHLSQAEAHLLAARDQRPGDFRTWAALGELYGVWGNAHDTRRLVEAHRALARATALAPHHATLYTAWGMVDLEGGRFDMAADRFGRAVALDETDGYAFLHLGDAEFARGYVLEALGAYRQAVRWEPALVGAHLGLARCYWRLGQAEAAARALERVLALDPGNPGALALRRVIEDR